MELDSPLGSVLRGARRGTGGRFFYLVNTYYPFGPFHGRAREAFFDSQQETNHARQVPELPRRTACPAGQGIETKRAR